MSKVKTNTKIEVKEREWPELPLDFKIRWIDALKSREFKQTTGTLVKIDEDTERPTGFCCLGVAGAIQGVPLNIMIYNATLENNFQSYAKYKIPECLIKDTLLVDHLVTMNDDDGKTFGQIAKWIEKNL